jgi:hypothetical protein
VIKSEYDVHSGSNFGSQSNGSKPSFDLSNGFGYTIFVFFAIVFFAIVFFAIVFFAIVFFAIVFFAIVFFAIVFFLT